MAMRSFDRTSKRATALGILAVLVLASASTLGPGQWLWQAFTLLFADRAATAGLDLSTYDPDFDAYAETWPARSDAARRPAARARSGFRLLFLRKNEAWGTGTPPTSARLTPYAGFGIGAFRLSMDLAEHGLGLSKESTQRKTRLFAGLGYRAAPNLTMNLEYRTLLTGEPLFTLDFGGLAFDVDSRFQDHTVNLKVRYRF
jgi:hypothetical protein